MRGVYGPLSNRRVFSRGVDLESFDHRDGLTVFEGGQVNAADIAAWSDDPFEVNRDGRADARNLATILAAMMDAYNP